MVAQTKYHLQKKLALSDGETSRSREQHVDVRSSIFIVLRGLFQSLSVSRSL